MKRFSGTVEGAFRKFPTSIPVTFIWESPAGECMNSTVMALPWPNRPCISTITGVNVGVLSSGEIAETNIQVQP